MAFADLNQQKLFLVRDPYGVKSVYYSTHQNQLVFASEIKPILRLLPDEVDAADEIDDAAETAQALGLEHLVKRIGAEDFFKIMEECIEIVEEPLAATSVIPMHYLSGLAAEYAITNW